MRLHHSPIGFINAIGLRLLDGTGNPSGCDGFFDRPQAVFTRLKSLCLFKILCGFRQTVELHVLKSASRMCGAAGWLEVLAPGSQLFRNLKISERTIDIGRIGSDFCFR